MFWVPLFPWDQKKTMRAIPSQYDALKMPTHTAGLGEKGMAWSKQTTSQSSTLLN